ncbi:MAG: type II secretion system protein [Ruminiclostridium sp.]|nr:type II secretion system protein [Ruminiclostridium sp.]
MKKLLKRKGFTLVECIVAIAIFALMSALVMQILALSIRQYRSNHHVETDMDTQIQNIVDYDKLVPRETVDIAIEFIKDGGTGTVGKIEVDDVSIKKSENNPDDPSGSERLELNTFDAVIKDDGGKDKDKQTGGMITDDIHCYGAKDIDGVYFKTTETDINEALKEIQIEMIIYDSKTVLSTAECNAIKLVLPGSAKNVAVTSIDANLDYLRLSKSEASINYRFYDNDISSKNSQYNATITFYMTPEDYAKDYVSYGKYFSDPKKPLADNQNGVTFIAKTPGIYNSV